MGGPATTPRTWLRQWGPLLLLLLVPVAWFPGALPGPRVVSADEHLSVHHAYGDPAEGRVRHPQLSDAPLQFAGLREAVRRSLLAGEAPLWNPDLYAGAPLAADAQSAPLSPLTWLHLALPEDTGQDADVVARLGAMGLGMALLALRLGAGPWGAAVAGAAGMTSPFLGVWLLHPHALVYCWLPWLLLAVEGRSRWGAALAVALVLAGGHPGTWLHVLALGAGWWLWRGRPRTVVEGVLLGVLMATPIWWLVLDNGLGSTTSAARGGTSLAPAALLDLVWPGWWGHPAHESFRGSFAWADGQLHPGLGALALAAWAAWTDSHRLARGLWLGFAVCLLLALSGVLPGPFDHARLGSEAAMLLALAAGLGARRLRGLLGLVAFVLVAGTGVWARSSDQGSLPAEAHDPAPAPWVAVVREAAGCSGPELHDCGRVLGLDWVLQPNTGARLGLRDVRGYDLPISVQTQALMAELSPRPQGPWYPVAEVPALSLLQAADVRLLLVHAEGDRPAGVEALEELELPVGSAVRALVLPEGPGRARWVGGGEVRAVPLREEGPGRRRLDLRGTGAGRVVLSETWHAGWRGELDGEPVAVGVEDGVFLGVDVPAGAEELVLDYAPRGWRWGRWLALLGWLGWLAVVIRSTRRAWR